MTSLSAELRALTFSDLVAIMWRLWWATLVASIPIAVILFVLAFIIARLNGHY